MKFVLVAIISDAFNAKEFTNYLYYNKQLTFFQYNRHITI